MTTDRTIRTAKALVWACALASVIIIGIGTAQPTITFRAIIFAIALAPASAAILIGSFVPDLTEWLKAHPGEHLLPAATVAREAGIKETTLRAYAGDSIKAAVTSRLRPAAKGDFNGNYWYKPSDVEAWLEKRAASKQLCRRHMQAIHWRKKRLPIQGNTTHDQQD